MTKSRWQVQGLKGSLAGLEGEWDRVNGRLMAGHPMLDSRFVAALLRHFGDGSEYLCRLERGGDIAGLCLLKPRGAGLWTTFLPPQAQVGPQLLADARDLPGLLSRLPGFAAQVDFLCLDPDFSPPARSWPATARPLRHVLTMNIRLDGGFDHYWQARPKKLRETLRTRENRIRRDGLDPRFACIDAPGAMAAAVARYGALESAGWKGRAGSAVGVDNRRGRFYADILESFAASGQALVCEYWLGERLAASQLLIRGGTMLIGLKTAYAEDLAAYSPGRLLLREVIREACVRFPGGVVEGYTNAGPELLAWASGQRWMEHVCLYRHPLLQRLAASIKAIRQLLARPLAGDRPAA